MTNDWAIYIKTAHQKAAKFIEDKNQCQCKWSNIYERKDIRKLAFLEITSLGEVKEKAQWQIVNVTNLPCSEEHQVSTHFIKIREA